MTGNKNAAPVLAHRDGRGDGRTLVHTTTIVHQAAAACKTYLLRCGAILASCAAARSWPRWHPSGGSVQSVPAPPAA